MRVFETVVALVVAFAGSASAYEGAEKEMRVAVGMAAINGNCDRAHELMGEDTYFHGLYEECLGLLAGDKRNTAKIAGDTTTAVEQARIQCDHYKRAIALWATLPTNGTEEDVKGRKKLRDELTEVVKTGCA